MNAEGQSTLNCSIGKVLRSLIELLCLGKLTGAKTKLAKYQVCAALRFITTKHYSAAAICWEICTLYGPELRFEGHKF